VAADAGRLSRFPAAQAIPCKMRVANWIRGIMDRPVPVACL
jgi:hypothetical protein